MKNALDITIVRKCHLCPDLGTDHVPSAGRNMDHHDLMIIGQSPGAEEVALEQPFVGASGELVDFMLDEAEINRNDVYIANALKCRPPNNRPGTKDELARCRIAWLSQEIKAVNPLVILTLGKDAWSSVLPHGKEFKHGVIYKSKKRAYVVSYHPSYFLRRNEISEFMKVAKLIREAIIPF